MFTLIKILSLKCLLLNIIVHIEHSGIYYVYSNINIKVKVFMIKPHSRNIIKTLVYTMYTLVCMNIKVKVFMFGPRGKTNTELVNTSLICLAFLVQLHSTNTLLEAQLPSN